MRYITVKTTCLTPAPELIVTSAMFINFISMKYTLPCVHFILLEYACFISLESVHLILLEPVNFISLEYTRFNLLQHVHFILL